MHQNADRRLRVCDVDCRASGRRGARRATRIIRSIKTSCIIQLRSRHYAFRISDGELREVLVLRLRYGTIQYDAMYDAIQYDMSLILTIFMSNTSMRSTFRCKCVEYDTLR